MSDIASTTSLDLSRLPPPAVVARLDFASIRGELIDDFRARWPGFDALLESDPAIKLLEVAAYRELLLRGAINDAARSVMLAFATGTDLDHRAAGYGVHRLVLTPATDTSSAVMESDDDLRFRAQLAAERLPYAGMTIGGYVSLARRAAPSVKDVSIIKRAGGHVDVVLLSRDGDGTVALDVVASVAKALADETATQLTDIVSVRAADIVPYSPKISLWVRRGPDPALVRAAAIAAVQAYAAERHHVGAAVYAQRLEAAASVGGVERAIVDIADVDPGAYGAAFLAELTIEAEVVG